MWPSRLAEKFASGTLLTGSFLMKANRLNGRLFCTKHLLTILVNILPSHLADLCMKNKTGVLLINLGTPDSPSVSDVRSYLSQFLNDPRVIDIPWLWRKLLVNFIIVPFRAPKSAKVYQKLWTQNGSPLLYHSKRAQELLQEELGGNYEVHLAMRYKNPSIPNVL